MGRTTETPHPAPVNRAKRSVSSVFVDTSPHERHSHRVTPIVLYDGGCALCNHTVRWLLRHDAKGVLLYAPLRGSTADRLRTEFSDIPDELDTVVFVELDPVRTRVSRRSRATLRIALYLEAPWRYLAWMRWIPANLADLIYRIIATLRHRLGRGLGPVQAPSTEVRSRFLD